MRLAPFLGLVALALTPIVSADFLRSEFNNFLPQISDGFAFLLTSDEHCGAAYRKHLEYQQERREGKRRSTRVPDGELDDVERLFHVDTTTLLLVECLLQNAPELTKALMAASQVLLGVAPTILALLGPSVVQIGVIAAAGRQYPLAMLLALASPTVSPSLDHSSVRQIFQDKKGRVGTFPWRPRGEEASRRKSLWPVLGQSLAYLLAMGSIANVAELCYRISSRTVFTFATRAGFLIYIWAFVGLTIHLLGALAVHLRIQRAPSSSKRSANEDHMLINHDDGDRKDRVQVLKSTATSTVLTWLAALYTTAHVFLGTLLFSSILFVSVNDAIHIVFRFLASTLLCRLIVELETAYVLSRLEVTGSGEGLGRRVPTAAEMNPYPGK
ncbi:unnamed protein product [Clonostachys solani]|uniref:Uncharacterized protein n=1 Tax=Clonostachys solani TaxID=160281 RepID=A0A9N9ZIY6_9HYPO|nr:unnamed protein product [Clonostachys solani]